MATNVSRIGQDLDALMPEKRAAEFLGLSIKTLQKRRVTGDGPVFIRISSRCVRYRRADLIAWANSLARSSTSDTRPTSKTPAPL
jgi:predicted DNA-binding transcriptional regulator AlpA